MSLEQSTRPREYLEKEFHSAIERSKLSIMVVAEHLKSLGYEVEIPEILVRDKISNRHKFEDNGDLFYWVPGGTDKKRVEVKHQEKYIKPFKSKETFPFPDVLVGRKHLVDKHFDSVYRYIMVSSDHKYGALINPNTRPYWVVTTKRKANWGTVETDYYCPIEYARIIKLEA